MIFNIKKQKSLVLLQAIMALLISTLPSLWGIIDSTLCLYILFAISGVILITRCQSNGIYLGVMQTVYLFLFVYSVFSSIWVSNRGVHFEYIVSVMLALMFFFLVTDYFSQSTENVVRRMKYMLSISGALCAAVNIIYWILYMVPYGEKQGFSFGIGKSDFLAVYMLISIVLTLGLLKGNNRFCKNLLLLSSVLMLFVFVMTKSVLGWAFLGILTFTYIFTLKWKKMKLPIFLVFTVIFAAIILALGFSLDDRKIFNDVFSYGIKSIAGKGGGFWSAKEGFFTNVYTESLPGLFAFLCAAAGIFGMGVCVISFLRVLWQCVKLKTWASFIGLCFTLMIMLLPMSKNYGVILMWIGLLAYNEKEAFAVRKKDLSQAANKKITYVISVMCVLAVFMLSQQLVRLSAHRCYQKQQYLAAYRLYAVATKINVIDAQSPLMAVDSLLKSKDIKNNSDDAMKLIETAIKRDKNNLNNIKLKAQIYYECERYEESVYEYTLLASKTKINNEYNLELVKALFKSIEEKPKGSGEAKAVYDKMIEIAQQTTDLDYREKINNIADKALSYTKGELNIEGEN